MLSDVQDKKLSHIFKWSANKIWALPIQPYRLSDLDT